MKKVLDWQAWFLIAIGLCIALEVFVVLDSTRAMAQVAPTAFPPTTVAPFPTAFPAQPTAAPFPTAQSCTPNLAFLGFKDFFDGYPVVPGQPFTVTFTVKNSGTCPWDSNYSIAYIRGDRMEGSTNPPRLGGIQPQAEVDVNLQLIGPQGLGEHVGIWKFINSNTGRVYGDDLVVRVLVLPEPSVTPNQTATVNAIATETAIAVTPAEAVATANSIATTDAIVKTAEANATATSIANVNASATSKANASATANAATVVASAIAGAKTAAANATATTRARATATPIPNTATPIPITATPIPNNPPSGIGFSDFVPWLLALALLVGAVVFASRPSFRRAPTPQTQTASPSPIAFPNPAPQPVPPNMVLQNRYEILRQLGSGGQASVYLARHLGLGGKLVALKQNVGGDARQFQNEAIMLANLAHPNLPRVLDHFVEPTGVAYLVMDYIDGQNLDSLVAQRGALAEGNVLGWMRPIFGAVKYLHANGIVHRDIKPANIIITDATPRPPVGGQPRGVASTQGRAILVDFGIAKTMASGGITATSARGMGTPGYAPPEQYVGGTTERSDIYALGATLYYTLIASRGLCRPVRSGRHEL